MFNLLPQRWFTLAVTAATALLGTPFTHAQPPTACSCVWHGSFAKLYDRADAIVSGQIVATKGNSADLQIRQILRQKDKAIDSYTDKIRFWGDDGKLCRPAIDQFTVGSDWLLALHKIAEVPEGGFNPSTPNVSFGRQGDFFLSSCGAYWLRLHEDRVSGNLIGGRRWSWDDTEMNPVLIDLVKANMDGIIPDQALVEASKPTTEAKKLLEQTKAFLRQQ